MSEEQTQLQKGDYLFLQRFLDATKSNLFFAKGIIMVEGDAENILLPVLAEILGYPIEKNGVSIVNVGSTAFLRYSRIFLRKDGSNIGVPVSIVTDCDIKPYNIVEQKDGTKDKVFYEKVEESEQAVAKKKQKYESGDIRAFVSPRWTLEYCLALSFLGKEFYRAIQYGKKIFNSENISLTDKKIQEVDKEIELEYQQWTSLSNPERAYNLFNEMLDKDGKSSLKAIVAQCLASILKWNISDIPEDITKEKCLIWICIATKSTRPIESDLSKI